MADEKKPVSAESLLQMTSNVVAAYVGNNALQPAQIPDVLRSVHETLSSLGDAPGGAETASQKPAVAPGKSIKSDHVVCLECGMKCKMLKRHLRTAHGLTPDEYRAKWNLPAGHAMVAPNYARQRSAFAKKIGLGRKAGSKRKRKN